MININKLDKLKKSFFQGSLNYTKNQPDLFLPHKYQIISPSTIDSFLDKLNISIQNDKRVLLYVHLPFCFSECVFCNSFPHKTNAQQQDIYFNSIVKEIELFVQTGLLEGKEVQGIYFGGGTPTSFANDKLKTILSTIKDSMNVVKGANITTEAHPATLANPTRIKNLSEIGFNRVSMGCQSFDPKILKICNRNHTKNDIKQIISTLNDYNMLNSLDMMVGLPGQTIDSVKRDMEILEDINPIAIEYLRHEIVNPIAIDMYKKNPSLVVKDEDLFQMVYLMHNWMQERGYEHNGNYKDMKFWEYRWHWCKELPIIAFGSRARSYSKTMSYDKHEDISMYSMLINNNKLPIGRYIELSEMEQMYRTLFLQLQLKKGLSLTDFKERYNQDAKNVFNALLNKLDEFNCIEYNNDHISLTECGVFFVEDVCDSIIDHVLALESKDLKRKPNSLGRTSARL